MHNLNLKFSVQTASSKSTVFSKYLKSCECSKISYKDFQEKYFDPIFLNAKPVTYSIWKLQSEESGVPTETVRFYQENFAG